MFKVGMGEKPETPENIYQEGHYLIDHCLHHDPKDRMTALEFLEHNFCVYGRGEYSSTEE
uniref:Protein kinase domain-containing protein n=1 Tax=Glossina palpalis gambiensis TaxID=67801 RepID=A0A1B0C1J4_9MUSC